MDFINLIFIGIMCLPVILAFWLRQSTTVKTHLKHQSGVNVSYWGVYHDAPATATGPSGTQGAVKLPAQVALPDDGHEKHEKNFCIHFHDAM